MVLKIRGVWINWSHGLVSGATLTLSTRDGGLLLSFIAAFITIVGSQLWKVVSFTWHQFLVKRGQQDGLHFQQRNILRNVTSPGAAAWAFLQQAWFWRGKAAWSFFRTIPWVLLTIAYLIVFGVLAVFSSQVSKSAGSGRLIRGQECGIWLPARPVTSTISIRATSEKNTQDIRTATTYARACYNQEDPPPQCDVFPKSTLAYTNQTKVACPFDESMCKNSSAYSVTSALLDSHHDLGINAAPSHRVQYRRQMTCAPVVLQGYVGFLTGADAEAMGYDNVSLVQYQYGTLTTTHTLNYTYLYNVYSKYANIGYTVSTAHWRRGGNSTWMPIPKLQTTAGDVDMLFIAFNSIYFEEASDDLIFSAHKPYVLNLTGGTNITYYEPDRFVSPMACLTTNQLCNPKTGKCSTAVGIEELEQEALKMDFTFPQLVTAYRILFAVSYTDFHNNVSPRASNALRAQDAVSETDQLYIPANQWEYEASGWFEDSLTRLQFTIQEYAAGPSSLVEGSRLYQPWSGEDANSPAAPYWLSQCSNQLTNGTQGTISFSIVGLIIIFVVGGVIIFLSLCLETIVGLIQRLSHTGEYQRLAWSLDSNIQTQRMLFESLGLGTWIGQTDAVPTTSAKEKFEGFDPHSSAKPSRQSTQNVGPDYAEKEVFVQSRPLLSSNDTERMSR